MSLSAHQVNYLDVTVKHENVKRAISSKHEYSFKKILASIGTEGIDWFHQNPFYEEERGFIAVCDFVFPKQKLIIELDGKDHLQKKKEDEKRDIVFYHNDFNVLRIKTPIEEGKLSYWKVYIEETLKILSDENQKKIASNKKPKYKKFTKSEIERFKQLFNMKLAKLQ